MMVEVVPYQMFRQRATMPHAFSVHGAQVLLIYLPSHQVEELLLGDPENSELEEMYSSLTEVIQLTQDLIKDALEQQQVAPPGGPSSSSVHRRTI
jgi:hypothetical protein